VHPADLLRRLACRLHHVQAVEGRHGVLLVLLSLHVQHLDRARRPAAYSMHSQLRQGLPARLHHGLKGRHQSMAAAVLGPGTPLQARIAESSHYTNWHMGHVWRAADLSVWLLRAAA
jgi:hypothetical protein